MTAACLEVLIGFTGAIGFLTRYIGPLSICPTVSLLGAKIANYLFVEKYILLTFDM